MSQELSLRMDVFKFLLQTGYTFDNALRIIKKTIKPSPEGENQVKYEKILKFIGDRLDSSHSAIDNIKAGEKAYREAMVVEADKRRIKKILNTVPKEDESNNSEVDNSLPELPRYIE